MLLIHLAASLALSVMAHIEDASADQAMTDVDGDVAVTLVRVNGRWFFHVPATMVSR